MENMYKVPSVNLEKLYEQIKKLNRRAKRNGLNPILVTEKGTELATNNDKTYIVHLLQIVGESPLINGWQLLAIIEHDGVFTVIRALPDVDVELYDAHMSDGSKPEVRCHLWRCGHCDSVWDYPDVKLMIDTHEVPPRETIVCASCQRKEKERFQPIA